MSFLLTDKVKMCYDINGWKENSPMYLKKGGIYLEVENISIGIMAKRIFKRMKESFLVAFFTGIAISQVVSVIMYYVTQASFNLYYPGELMIRILVSAVTVFVMLVMIIIDAYIDLIRERRHCSKT